MVLYAMPLKHKPFVNVGHSHFNRQMKSICFTHSIRLNVPPIFEGGTLWGLNKLEGPYEHPYSKPEPSNLSVSNNLETLVFHLVTPIIQIKMDEECRAGNLEGFNL